MLLLFRTSVDRDSDYFVIEGDNFDICTAKFTEAFKQENKKNYTTDGSETFKFELHQPGSLQAHGFTDGLNSMGEITIHTGDYDVDVYVEVLEISDGVTFSLEH